MADGKNNGHTNRTVQRLLEKLNILQLVKKSFVGKKLKGYRRVNKSPRKNLGNE
jgi:hypothetical protein